MIFDLDGTLVDSGACVIASLEQALRACGRPFDPTTVRDHIGQPLDCIVRAASPGIEQRALSAVVGAYARSYAALERELVSPFPGALETLELFRAADRRLALATNRTAARTRPSLERLGVASLFDAIICADDVRNAKPHPESVHRVLEATAEAATAALVVGDTVWDIQMAARAGVASCAVTWGNHDAVRLSRDAPTHCAETFETLRQIVVAAAR